nr:hypothetical protein [Nitrospira sp. KM1]
MNHSKDLVRIHVFGASGSGVTTLSKALAEALCLPYRDTDDYLWMPTEPPYQTKRPLAGRVAMLTRDSQAPKWILGGSLDQWGTDAVVPRLTLAIFLTLEQSERLARLKQREHFRFGDRIALGGDMYQTHLAFMEWATAYESDRLDLRTRARHEQWMRTLSCPIIRVSGMLPTTEQVNMVLGNHTE